MLTKKIAKAIGQAIDRALLAVTDGLLKGVEEIYRWSGVLSGASSVDKQVIDDLSRVTEMYMEAERVRAKAQVLKSLSDAIKNGEKVEGIVDGVLEKSKANLVRVIENEVNTAKNLGALEGIVKTQEGSEDPRMFWICVHDDKLCLSQEELVRTPQGPREVGSLKAGDFVESTSGLAMVKTITKKPAEVISLTFDDGKVLRCTPDHPILVRLKHSFSFIPAASLDPSHDVVDWNNIKNSQQRAAITRSLSSREFMKGYRDAWSYWMINAAPMRILVETVGVKEAAATAGIPLRTFQTYVMDLLKAWFPEFRPKGGARLGNSLRLDYLSSLPVVMDRWRSDLTRLGNYLNLGGPVWLNEQMLNGRSLKEISKEVKIPARLLSYHVSSETMSRIKSRGGSATWRLHRESLIERFQYRHQGVFKSKPEKLLAELLLAKGVQFQAGPLLLGRLRVDFLVGSSLVVEFDGSGHDLRDRLVKNSTPKITNKNDYLRDKALKQAGFRILRIKSPKDRVPAALVDKIVESLHSDRIFETCHV